MLITYGGSLDHNEGTVVRKLLSLLTSLMTSQIKSDSPKMTRLNQARVVCTGALYGKIISAWMRAVAINDHKLGAQHLDSWKGLWKGQGGHGLVRRDGSPAFFASLHVHSR